jgi:hypothetical protein
MQPVMIDRIRAITQSGQCRKIDGRLIDIATANAILQVHTALSPGNQDKFVALPVWKMAAIAWKLMG